MLTQLIIDLESEPQITFETIKNGQKYENE